MTGRNVGKEILDRAEALRLSPEWKVHSQLRELQFTFSLHAANYQHLMTLSEEVVGDTDEKVTKIFELWSANHRERVDQWVSEGCRLLLNFLASAKMLVDHTRNHVGELYANHTFEAEYKAEARRRFAFNPLSRFVQQLRDYNLHRRIPAIVGTMEVEDVQGDGIPRIALFLNLKGLEQWDRWSPPAKRFLAQQSELRLAKLAEDYMKLVVDFYQWLWAREREIWGDALTRVEAESRAIMELDKSVFPDRYKAE